MMSDKDFFVSLEWVWRISKLTPNSQRNFCLMLFFKKNGIKKKNGKKMSLENLQTLSKLKKNMRSQLFFEFFWVVERILFSKKKLWTHIFFWVWREFGESMVSFKKNIFFWKMTSSKDFFVSLEILQTLSKLTPNSLQTHMFPFFSFFFYFTIFLEKGNEFGVSLEILQTLSKLAPNSYVFIFFVFSVLLFFEKEEWVWRFSKLSPNSYVFIFCYLLFLYKRNEFGVSLEILQTDSKFGPNSYVFMFFLFYFFFLKRGMSLEWVWRLSKLSPNSIQTQMISCFVVFSLYCFFIFVWKRQTTLEWVWRFSKLSPNSLQTHMVSFCCFFFIVNLLFFFFEKGMSFHFLYWIFLKKKKWIWRFPKVSPISLRALVATPLGPEITYSGRCFIGTYQINFVNAYHPERLSSCKLSK